jgi:pilus assembly protein CpaF
VTEVQRLEGDVITLQDLFVARPPNDGELSEASVKRLLSPLRCSGLKPHFLDKLAAHGVVLPQTFFDLDDEL